ncbi:nucleosidase [Corynebacterium timonense]|uniref:Adenosylhomocysteine nucleosidase n=1 Tax=Corynebacterium timonense TaxID=441500 RepID=A0A1H1VG40_9CORY|nr:nucleosidase [Corynebacterium timonense]SDS83712.1 adenosylhomocysteine nucleosidase [Corynebacterium timonense]
MSILIVAAMNEEAAVIAARTDHEVLVTGIGTIPAAVRLSRRLAAGPAPERVVNVGTAGALSDVAAGVYEISSVVKHDHKALEVPGLTDFVYPRRIALEPVSDLPQARLATGDTFVNDSALRAELARESDLVDMEGYALAAVCGEFGVPLTMLKQVSDNADESSDVSWPEALAAAAEDLHGALARL